jgi:hypothetical protein
MTAKFNYGWPRGLSLAEAAADVGVGTAKFHQEVRAGIWPEPYRRGAQLVWDRKLIDEAYDR